MIWYVLYCHDFILVAPCPPQLGLFWVSLASLLLGRPLVIYPLIPYPIFLILNLVVRTFSRAVLFQLLFFVVISKFLLTK